MIIMPLVLGRLINLLSWAVSARECAEACILLIITNYMLSIACDHIPLSVYKCIVLQNVFKSLRWLSKPFSTEAFEDKQFKLIDDCLRSRE